MIKLNNVTKTIKNKTIISDFSYTFEKGKIYLLTGHNGCGKTMLLRLLSGLISPNKGTIEFDKKFSCGLTIENPAFMEKESAFYNLKFLANINKTIDENKILETLKTVNLLESKDELVKKFSLGMKQRLALAQALMENPDIILLDEPFNALDEENLNNITKLLEHEKKQNKIIIIAAHGFYDQFNIIDEKLKLSNGKLLT